DFGAQPVERFVTAGQSLTQEELRQCEHREQENHNQKQGAQHIDETRPDIQRETAASAAARGDAHDRTSSSGAGAVRRTALSSAPPSVRASSLISLRRSFTS